jgi:hypothetical protein
LFAGRLLAAPLAAPLLPAPKAETKTPAAKANVAVAAPRRSQLREADIETLLSKSPTFHCEIENASALGARAWHSRTALSTDIDNGLDNGV